MYGICCLYCLLSFYQSILSSQRRSVTSTSSGAESSVKAFFFHFAKIIIFSENLSFFCCFFSFFSLPWLSHSLPRLSHSLPWFCSHIPLSNVCLTHPTCRGKSFKKLPRVLKLLPLQGALLIALYPGCCPGLWASAPSGRAACVFCKEKAFTFWAFLSQRVHRFTPFVTFWWIPVKGGFTPCPPLFIGLPTLMWRVNPRFLLSHAYAKRNKIKKENSSMGNAIKHIKRIYIYYNRRSRCHSVVSTDRLFRRAND